MASAGPGPWGPLGTVARISSAMLTWGREAALAICAGLRRSLRAPGLRRGPAHSLQGSRGGTRFPGAARRRRERPIGRGPGKREQRDPKRAPGPGGAPGVGTPFLPFLPGGGCEYFAHRRGPGPPCSRPPAPHRSLLADRAAWGGAGASLTTCAPLPTSEPGLRRGPRSSRCSPAPALGSRPASPLPPPICRLPPGSAPRLPLSETRALWQQGAPASSRPPPAPHQKVAPDLWAAATPPPARSAALRGRRSGNPQARQISQLLEEMGPALLITAHKYTSKELRYLEEPN
ncbi:putative cuticle collagen 80 [Sciurus carolinensis]|uniref:putative cuticle collagen 80 n=1 Tax=Sciurus carolinensis TaxID=30640 RepID=UPI001FB53A91|nr:putative cuticle collagen 80 [Sciurus carolinensis]